MLAWLAGIGFAADDFVPVNAKYADGTIRTINIAEIGIDWVTNTSKFIDPEYRIHYIQLLGIYNNLPPIVGSIIFLGDSHVELFPWPEYIHSDKKILNRGIASDNIEMLKTRVSFVSSYKPKYLVIIVGQNDIRRGSRPTDVLNSYKQLLAEIKKQSPQTAVIVVGIQPVNEFMRKETLNRKIEEANALLRGLADKDKAIAFFDSYPLLLGDQNQLRPDCTVDGVHLNFEGYRRICTELQKLIR